MDVSTLNEEPGGNEPSSARLNPPLDPGTLTEASTCPVLALTATRAALLVHARQGLLGGLLHRRIDARLHGVPERGLSAATVPTVAPAGLTAVIVAPGRPASPR